MENLGPVFTGQVEVSNVPIFVCLVEFLGSGCSRLNLLLKSADIKYLFLGLILEYSIYQKMNLFSAVLSFKLKKMSKETWVRDPIQHLNRSDWPSHSSIVTNWVSKLPTNLIPNLIVKLRSNYHNLFTWCLFQIQRIKQGKELSRMSRRR